MSDSLNKQPVNLPADTPNSLDALPASDLMNVADAADVAGVVSRLYVYPIKSCAGVQVNDVLLTETGLEFDRAWMVVDAQGHFLTQRELPRMALIKPQLRYYDMVLRAPGMLALHIALDQVEEAVQVQIWKEIVQAYDMGPIAAQWFTDFLGKPARLVRFDPDHKRICSPKWTGDVQALNQFSDGFPVLVISEASLDQFNEKMVAAGGLAVGMDRFRPNIVIGPGPSMVGTDNLDMAPHDEDRLDLMTIATGQGLAQLKFVKPCPRCPIPNIDQATAVIDPVVGDLLQGYRKDPRLNGAVTFGMNAIVLRGVDFQIKVGQSVGGNFRFED